MTQRLEIRNLAVAYGRTAVVHGIDLHVQAGEMVALLGANGAGKTSILRAISHQQVTAKGTLRFEGQDIIDMAAPAIASLTAFFGVRHLLHTKPTYGPSTAPRHPLAHTRP